jgi:Flp pilus assembly protein TadG
VTTVRNCHRIIRSTAGSDESGVALVEFALVLPLLLLVLFGMLDFGKAFNYWIDETHLANEAARWAVVNTNPGSGTLQAYTLSQADTTELRTGGTSSVPGQAQVCISFPTNPQTGTSAQVGDPVQVTVTVAYNWMPFIRSSTGLTNVTLTGESTMRLEAKPTTYTAGCS